MKRQLAGALGALALGWLSGTAAADPVPPPVLAQLAAGQPAAPAATLPPAPAAAPTPPAPTTTPAPHAPGMPHGVPHAPDAAMPHAVPHHAPHAPACCGPTIVQSCDACCPSQCGRSGVIGGVGFYYMQPYWKSNKAFTVTVDRGPGAGFSDRLQQVTHDFNHDYEFAPLLWAGYVNECGLGGRIRWWHFDHSSNAYQALRGRADREIDIFSAGPLDVPFVSIGDEFGQPSRIAIDSSLYLDVWDLEVIQVYQPCNWSLLISAGGRYAHLAQNYNAFGVDPGDIIQPGALRSGHNFNGAGPTASLEVRRGVGGGLALYGSARGALLFGTARQAAFRKSVGFDPESEDLGMVRFSAAATRDDVIPVAELELGGEFGRDMGASRAFLQAAFVSQTWFGAGSAAQTNLTGNAADNNANLGFFGIKIAAGVNF